MTDAQFAELITRLETFELMVFTGFMVVVFAVAWLVGGQR
ncbi:hypothetical protein JCM19233_4894 [Vibrio astriarenae]|nr:hypothetical protein JCM19233_4894 [Vibrio sp. C7]